MIYLVIFLFVWNSVLTFLVIKNIISYDGVCVYYPALRKDGLWWIARSTWGSTGSMIIRYPWIKR